jgi:hypothetical protein
LSKAFKAICKKILKTEPKLSKRAIYGRIEAYQKKNKILSTRLAQNAYAYEVMGFHVSKLGLKKEEIAELQELLDKKKQPILQELTEQNEEVKIPKIRKKIIKEFGLPPNLVNEANRMAKVYPDIYVLENILRYVVMTVLEEEHGKQWWTEPNVVSNKIKETVTERKRIELANRWVSKRGAHEIFYTNFNDLSKIIHSNPNSFKQVFADLPIEAEVKKLEKSRNIIAHNNPLPEKEVKRIEICLDDLKKQLQIFVEKRNVNRAI